MEWKTERNVAPWTGYVLEMTVEMTRNNSDNLSVDSCQMFLFSRAVPHLSTIWALRRFTSEVS